MERRIAAPSRPGPQPRWRLRPAPSEDRRACRESTTSSSRRRLGRFRLQPPTRSRRRRKAVKGPQPTAVLQKVAIFMCFVNR
ncbi:hypothetical protein MRX96_014786 [Rhipicephalus microplus]